MPSYVITGGEVLEIAGGAPGWIPGLIEETVGGTPRTSPPAPPTVRLRIEDSTEPFSRAGMSVLTRGAHGDGSRVLLADACSSGFDLLAEAEDDVLTVRARYRPAPKTRAANTVLRSRFRLLAGQTLVHYPVLWRAGWRGRAPLHVSVVGTAGRTVMLAGPGGVGKSSLVRKAIALGARATADNLCVADATTCYGIAEPMRTDAHGAGGPATSHGRVAQPFADRMERLDPDRLVVLARGPKTEIAELGPAEAARVLTAGTYAGGELRRYWAFCATLALGTGRGPAHPPIAELAEGYAAALPRFLVTIADGESVGIEELP
ncbi:hypothetical protein [Nonomuraea sediminis]|uniref:hypothetical protein n=1 Tax=Nonomuraea sediminis TaxID=2835864 RepID=UPI001BDDBFFC|nr:hypothetical protein [Nonomuraea sediminis]